jgi:hypothetical protein
MDLQKVILIISGTARVRHDLRFLCARIAGAPEQRTIDLAAAQDSFGLDEPNGSINRSAEHEPQILDLTPHKIER